MNAMKLKYDKVADALYVTLREEPWAYTKSLDDSRNIDYSAAREPIGVEWLCVREGVDLSGIPRADEIVELLSGKFKVFA